MFPVENRYIDGQLQDFNALSTYISKWSPNQFLEAVSDFHLLLYLYFMDMLPMKSSMGPLLDAVRTKNYAAALQWKEQEVWSTLETLITASSSASGSVEMPPCLSSLFSQPPDNIYPCMTYLTFSFYITAEWDTIRIRMKSRRNLIGRVITAPS